MKESPDKKKCCLNLKPDSMKFENTQLSEWWTYWKKKAALFTTDLQTCSELLLNNWSTKIKLLSMSTLLQNTTVDDKADNFIQI